jgi:lysophospholipase
MGGAILLEHAHRGETPFSRMVLCAPMIDLVLRYPRLARFAALALHVVGLGKAYVPTGGRAPVVAHGFENNPLTTDRFRFERLAKLLAREPQISLGDPTIDWVRAAFVQMARFANPAFPRAISTPVLIFAPQNDVVTDSFATERFCANLKTGKLIWMPQARHEILMEQDHIRARFWAAFDAFIPGTTQEAEALLARHAAEL